MISRPPKRCGCCPGKGWRATGRERSTWRRRWRSTVIFITRITDASSSDEPGPQRWTQADYILADVFDLLAAVHTKDPVDPYPRPKRRKRRASPERVAQLRARTGRR